MAMQGEIIRLRWSRGFRSTSKDSRPASDKGRDGADISARTARTMNFWQKNVKTQMQKAILGWA